MARHSGHFRFESGHHGDRWLEPDLLLQRPTALRRFAIALRCRTRSRPGSARKAGEQPLDSGGVSAVYCRGTLGRSFRVDLTELSRRLLTLAELLAVPSAIGWTPRRGPSHR